MTARETLLQAATRRSRRPNARELAGRLHAAGVGPDAPAPVELPPLNAVQLPLPLQMFLFPPEAR